MTKSSDISSSFQAPGRRKRISVTSVEKSPLIAFVSERGDVGTSRILQIDNQVWTYRVGYPGSLRVEFIKEEPND